jgi:1-deoxy-D-xylulose-5-phosphate reductoisomerase
MVEYCDGSTIAQLSNPDMRLPIQYALTWPDRVKGGGIKLLDFSKITQLDFGAPDFKKFACLRLALQAATLGGTMPAVMNAANETAVELFLKEKIQFTDIPKIVEESMSAHHVVELPGIEDIIDVDSAARARIHEHWSTTA